MKKQKKKKEKFEIKWWEDWLNADILKKEKMVRNLPIVKTIWNLKNIPENTRRELFAQMLNGFFQDLENAVYTKIRNEEKC